VLAALQLAGAQSLTLPGTVQAGAAFDVQTSGSGNGTLYIVGPSQVLQQKVTLGQTASFDSGTLTTTQLTTSGSGTTTTSTTTQTTSGTFVDTTQR